MDEPRLFKDILAEAVEASEISVDKIIGATGVPERFIMALIEGNYQFLPAAPYTKGYIKKIAGVLGVKPDELWVAFERESRPMRSGAGDALPRNRFLMSVNFNNRKLAIYLAIIAVVIYAGINAKRLIGAPGLSIISPTEPVTRTAEGLALIRGRVENPQDIVTINGSAIYVDEFGEFQKEFTLDPGLNNFDVAAKRFLGRGKLESRQIIYEPTPLPEENKNNKVE